MKYFGNFSPHTTVQTTVASVDTDIGSVHTLDPGSGFINTVAAGSNNLDIASA